MCGISGILLANQQQNCSVEIYESLNVLQHRGQVRIFYFVYVFLYI